MYPVQEMEQAFLEAALVGDLPRVKDLISQGCPVNAQNKVITLVHLQSRTQHSSVESNNKLQLPYLPTPTSTHPHMHTTTLTTTPCTLKVTCINTSLESVFFSILLWYACCNVKT